jgi:hypothetical protein
MSIQLDKKSFKGVNSHSAFLTKIGITYEKVATHLLGVMIVSLICCKFLLLCSLRLKPSNGVLKDYLSVTYTCSRHSILLDTSRELKPRT